MKKRASQLATLCYIRHQGRTLMLHRVKKKNDVHKNRWNGLGGKFLSGETPEECVKREVKEESGLILEEMELKGVIMFPEFTPGTDWMVFVYLATEFSGHLINARQSKEGQLEWIEDKDILNLNLWEGDRIFMPWLQSSAFFSAKFVYQKKKLVSHHVEFY